MDTSALSLGTALHGLSSERPSLGQADGPGLLRGHQEAVLSCGGTFKSRSLEAISVMFSAL